MAGKVQCYNNVLQFLQGVNFSKFGKLQEICECSSYKGQYVCS